MKISRHIKIFLLGVLGFCILGFIILYSQSRRFDNLIENGRYTIAQGEEIKKRRTGWSFIFNYKVHNEVYDGRIKFMVNKWGMKKGGIYFVVFDPNNPKKEMLIRYPSVPEINLDSIPAEGWAELPVPVPKDSIRNFLD